MLPSWEYASLDPERAEEVVLIDLKGYKYFEQEH